MILSLLKEKAGGRQRCEGTIYFNSANKHLEIGGLYNYKFNNVVEG